MIAPQNRWISSLVLFGLLTSYSSIIAEEPPIGPPLVPPSTSDQPTQVRPFPQPQLVQPTPTSLPQPARVPESIAHLQVCVLQIRDNKLADAEALVRAFVREPQSYDANSTLFFLGTDQQRSNKLISQMLDTKLADVVSRPQLIALAGKSAEVQVGQQIAVVASDDEQPNQHLGLSLTCKPQRLPNPNRMRLSISCTNRTVSDQPNVVIKGQTYPAINEQKMETTIEAGSGETVVLRSPNKKMLVMVTPTWAPRPPMAVKQAGFLPLPPLAAPAAPSPLDDLVQLQNLLKLIEGVDVLDLSMKGEMFETTFLIDDSARINEISEALSTQPRIELRAAHVANSGNGSRVQLEGRILRSEPRAANRDEAMMMLRQEVKAMRDEIRQLADQGQQ